MITLEIITDNTAEVLRSKEAAVAKALEMIGQSAEDYAKGLCPVDTGNLRNSISHASDGEQVVIGTNVEYAPYVEFGHTQAYSGRWIPEQPYLRPAAENHTGEYQLMLQECLKQA